MFQYKKSCSKNYLKIEEDMILLKVKILYQLSKLTAIDMITLIEKELPEAMMCKYVWEDYFNVHTNNLNK